MKTFLLSYPSSTGIAYKLVYEENLPDAINKLYYYLSDDIDINSIVNCTI
jgi:hypothetical protein